MDDNKRRTYKSVPGLNEYAICLKCEGYVLGPGVWERETYECTCLEPRITVGDCYAP